MQRSRISCHQMFGTTPRRSVSGCSCAGSSSWPPDKENQYEQHRPEQLTQNLESLGNGKGQHMSTIHMHETTTLTPGQYIAGLTDFGPGRSKLFGNSAEGYLKVHSRGPSQADVTEGSAGIWERLR